MKKFSKQEILTKLNDVIAQQKAIIVTAAGIGLCAKCHEYAGSDMILTDSMARIRMAGASSLAGINSYKNANELLAEETNEILPIVKNTPVIAGVLASVDTGDMDTFIDNLLKAGFSGICNSPSYGCNRKYDNVTEGELKIQGFGYGYEVDFIKKLSDKNIFTLAYCYTPYQAKLMAEAGADVICAHVGLTKGGLNGASEYPTLDEAIDMITDMSKAAKEQKSDVIVLCSGGPMATPQDVSYVLEKLNGSADGFLSCSPTDRLPMEEGIISVSKAFADTKLYGYNK